jgi:hypothetical protein
MLGECALSLALDDLPTTSGQTTTAAALGPALRERLVRAGITFRVLSTEDYCGPDGAATRQGQRPRRRAADRREDDAPEAALGYLG